MAEDPNASLKQTVISYVQKSVDPGHAILLTGVWGVGKTFVINELIDDGFGDVKPIYVSLYGVASKDNFDNAVFAALYPYMDTKVAKIGSAIGAAVLRKFVINPEIKPSQLFDILKTGVFIFDDLERISEDISIQTVMGFLNQYIEHEGCRVILVCNEKEIKGKDVFRETKEKLVGRTLRIKPAISQALTSYLANVQDEGCRSLIETLRPLIEKIYNQSQVNNLRILKQSVWDLEQFLSSLEEKHLAKADALDSAVRLFLLYAIEAKNGSFTADELLKSGYGYDIENRRKEGKLTSLDKITDKYPDIYIYDDVLEKNVIKSMIFDGEFPLVDIRASLNKSRYFIEPEDEEEWKTLYCYSQREDEVLNAAAGVLEEKYKNHEYQDPFILLHVFTQRLWLSSIGYLKEDEEAIIDSAKEYIDGLVEINKLKPRYLSENYSREFESYDRFGFSGKNEQPFKTVADYIKTKFKEVLERDLKDNAPQFLELMSENFTEFEKQLLPIQSKENKYWRHPILVNIDASIFVKKLLSLSVGDQRKVFELFERRYSSSVKKKLSEEIEWIQDMVQQLKEELKDKNVFTQDRINKFIRWHLEDILKQDHV